MLKSTLKKDSTYYLDENANYLNAHLVTDKPYNKELDIRHIQLQKPNTRNIKAPIYKATIEFNNNITIGFDIFCSKKKDCLYLSLPVRTYSDYRGKVHYVEQVKFTPAISAQILRYATFEMNK